MTRSLVLSAALICIVTLVCSHSLSAKAVGTLVQTKDQSVTLLNTATSVFPSRALSIWAGSNYIIDDDVNKNKDGDGNGDWSKWYKDDRHRHHHEPTPEPSTLLSFGAAILIGGGVLYSRRLRKSK